jgi:uncharacterized protein (DUF927 family)
MTTPRDTALTPDQIATVYQEFVPNLKQHGKQWRAPCPIHQGKRNSFSINSETGLWSCHSECGRGGDAYNLYQALHGGTFLQAKEAIQRLLGLTIAFVPKVTPKKAKDSDIVAIYPYRDETSRVLYETIRKQPKDFRQRRPDGKGGYTWNLKGTRLVPYRLPELLASTGRVFIVEGEKDVETLVQWGLIATCSPLGACKWDKLDPATLQYFKGRVVVIISDNDPPGREHALQVARSLYGITKQIIILDLPNLPLKGDVSDWVFQGGTLEQLEALVNVAEEWHSIPDLKVVPHAVLLSDFLTDAPCDGLALPLAWRVRKAGVSFLKLDREGDVEEVEVTASPFFVRSRCINVDSNTEKLELLYLRDHAWKPIFIERGIALDQRKVVQLADYGLPVDSTNSKLVVKYLHAFEAANADHLPRHLTVSGFGWKGRNHDAYFVLRDRTIGREEKITFEADAMGSERMAQGLRAEGELTRWVEAVRKAVPYPKVLFALYAAFVPPLQELLRAPNFIVHFYGQTSVGKTSAVAISASVWGQPALGGMLVGWDATRVSVERVAALFNHIPLYLDDLQVAQDKVVEHILYMVANGIGRLRGALKGMQATATWRTVAFSTGEKPVKEVTEYEGARARTLDLYGSPFGTKSAADVVQSILRELQSHFGHAGPAFVAEVLPYIQDERRADRLRAEYTEKVNQLAVRSRSNVANRMAQYVAAVWSAAEIAEHLFGFGGNPREVVTKIFDEACGQLVEGGGDYTQRALEFLISWVQGNRNYFDTSEEQATVDRGEVFGVIRDAEYIGIFPHKFKEIVRRQGWSPDVLLRSFQERGWLQANAGHTYPVGFRGQMSRMVKIMWRCLSESKDRS